MIRRRCLRVMVLPWWTYLPGWPARHDGGLGDTVTRAGIASHSPSSTPDYWSRNAIGIGRIISFNPERRGAAGAAADSGGAARFAYTRRPSCNATVSRLVGGSRVQASTA